LPGGVDRPRSRHLHSGERGSVPSGGNRREHRLTVRPTLQPHALRPHAADPRGDGGGRSTRSPRLAPERSSHRLLAPRGRPIRRVLAPVRPLPRKIGTSGRVSTGFSPKRPRNRVLSTLSCGFPGNSVFWSGICSEIRKFDPIRAYFRGFLGYLGQILGLGAGIGGDRRDSDPTSPGFAISGSRWRGAPRPSPHQPARRRWAGLDGDVESRRDRTERSVWGWDGTGSRPGRELATWSAPGQCLGLRRGGAFLSN
jgi:hypothetical protein